MKECRSLCYRCEKRAEYLETGYGPRCECQQSHTAVHSCYCYEPVIPVLLKTNTGDKRPQFAGAMISARSHVELIPERGKEIVLDIKKYKGGNMIFWIPKPKKVKIV